MLQYATVTDVIFSPIFPCLNTATHSCRLNSSKVGVLCQYKISRSSKILVGPFDHRVRKHPSGPTCQRMLASACVRVEKRKILGEERPASHVAEFIGSWAALVNYSLCLLLFIVLSVRVINLI